MILPQVMLSGCGMFRLLPCVAVVLPGDWHVHAQHAALLAKDTVSCACPLLEHSPKCSSSLASACLLMKYNVGLCSAMLLLLLPWPQRLISLVMTAWSQVPSASSTVMRHHHANCWPTPAECPGNKLSHVYRTDGRCHVCVAILFADAGVLHLVSALHG